MPSFAAILIFFVAHSAGIARSLHCLCHVSLGGQTTVGAKYVADAMAREVIVVRVFCFYKLRVDILKLNRAVCLMPLSTRWNDERSEYICALAFRIGGPGGVAVML